MNQYYKISNGGEINKINYFNPLFGCFEDMCSCSMGLFFPFCLFGRIYEKAEFGSCLMGCTKYFSLQMIISFFFTSMIYSVEWEMLLSKEYKFLNDINNCNTNTTCKINYANFNKTRCIVDNSTVICDCLRKPLHNQCDFTNSLPNTLENMSAYILLISIINTFTICTALGLFLGHYRKKLSHKYNILYNSRYNFLIHFLPCTNQCALCQEYNTLTLIDSVIQVDPPVHVKF